VAALIYQKGLAVSKLEDEDALVSAHSGKAPPMALSAESMVCNLCSCLALAIVLTLPQADPNYIKLTAQWDAAWADFDACYSDGVRHFVHILQNIPLVARSKAVTLLDLEKLPAVSIPCGLQHSESGLYFV
jgi:hypothetical protein